MNQLVQLVHVCPAAHGGGGCRTPPRRRGACWACPPARGHRAPACSRARWRHLRRPSLPCCRAPPPPFCALFAEEAERAVAERDKAARRAHRAQREVHLGVARQVPVAHVVEREQVAPPTLARMRAAVSGVDRGARGAVAAAVRRVHGARRQPDGHARLHELGLDQRSRVRARGDFGP